MAARSTMRWKRRHYHGSGLIFASMLAVAAGGLCQHYLSPPQARAVAANLGVITEAFLRLIQMIIAPLVFASLTTAIARMGSAAELGRIGLKTLTWFLAASCVSLALGLGMAHWLQPGASLHALHALTVATPSLAESAQTVPPVDLSLAGFMRQLIPRSGIEAMAHNEILQIVVFAVLAGTAAAELQDRAARFVALLEQVASIMFKLTDYVMKTVPLVIFAALTSAIALHGLSLIGVYARFVAGYYLALAILWLLLISILLAITGARGLKLLANIRQPVWLAFVSASSEAAYPRLLETLVEFGLPRRVASFVLPLGYAFNLDGAMMYATFAVLFIAQAYGVALDGKQQLMLFGLLLVTTKGLAGVPRAVIAVLAVTLHYFQLPVSGVALVLAVDPIMDMGRSATNILGNAVATAAVSRWEGRTSMAWPEPPA